MNEEQAWRRLLAMAERGLAGPAPDSASLNETPAAEEVFPCPGEANGAWPVELYQPLCRAAGERFVVGHLGQSLDGRIATRNGASRWVTGPGDVVHNHRMRALFDAVVVGAGTVRHDDPRLTVREVEGCNPVRVVLDPGRRLGDGYRIFRDGAAPTLLLCDPALTRPGERHGAAEVAGIAMADGQLCPRAVLGELAGRGLSRVFVEGGGVTVSRFLAAGCLDRLQITVAPVLIGSGRPSITLPEVERLSACLRPPTRHFILGDDVLFECRFDA